MRTSLEENTGDLEHGIGSNVTPSVFLCFGLLSSIKKHASLGFEKADEKSGSEKERGTGGTSLCASFRKCVLEKSFKTFTERFRP